MTCAPAASTAVRAPHDVAANHVIPRREDNERLKRWPVLFKTINSQG